MAPTNKAAPTITGQPEQREVLTASPGQWEEATGTFTYAWERSSETAAWTPIPGAAGSSYTVADADVGDALRVAVSASDATDATATARSEPTATIQAAEADPWATGLAIGLVLTAFVLAFVLAGWVDWTRRPWKADADFALFAGFYAAAQIIERLLETFAHLIPPWGSSARARANRAQVLLGIATLAATIVSMAFGLYFLDAIGVRENHWLRAADVIATALVISGGTKPLHDFISLIEKAKTNASAPTTTGARAGQ